MEQPLWTEKYRPSVSDIPQPDARGYLEEASDSSLNLLVYGPRGSGKTAAVRALGDAAHEDPDNDVMFINAADFFSMSKKELGEDPRFASFITSKRRRNMSKGALMNHVLKELAGYQPVSGTYKTLVIDNAEDMRGDFQQALRRVIEQHHETTQFVLVARSSSGIIPAIQSRCSPLPMEAPSFEATVEILRDIAEQEELEYTDDGIAFIAGYSDQNLREAILGLQTVASQEDEITDQGAAEALSDVGVDSEIEAALDAAENGDIKDGRKTIDSLLIDEGMEGDEVLRLLVEQTQYRYPEVTTVELVETAAEIDLELSNGSSDRVHLTNFLTEVAHAT